MGIKQYKPTTPSLRWTALSDFSEITKERPEKFLTEPLKKTGGRNCHGRVTSRWRGGGHKSQNKDIKFKRGKMGIPIKDIPAGTPIHNLELRKGRGGKIVRSAGTYAQILAKEDRYAHIKLPSGEVRDRKSVV